MTHQQALLMRALDERGIAGVVTVDHLNGTAAVDDRNVGLIYPDSFFERTAEMTAAPKPVEFFFCGHLKGPGRKLVSLERFRGPGSSITHSPWGRHRGNKGHFDPAYFRGLAAARFGLCPHHTTWPGDPARTWTYRFAECCMVGAVPVLFRETPLGPCFVEGFRYVWDDADEFAYSPDDARHNRTLAEQRWALP